MAFREEAFSFFTHLGGALAGLVALVLMVQRAQGVIATMAFAAYGITLVIMFSSSTLHHVAHREDGLLRRLDLTAIYLFIAGTYTPVCLIALRNEGGITVAIIVWALALVGISLRWWRPVTPRWVTAGIYLGMGWFAVLGVVPLTRAMGWNALYFLFGGGLVYTVGAIIYAMKKPDPWPLYVGYHGLWHVFVLVAAGLHFWLIWHYVPMAG
ncbi:MAG: hemolysin III family protein [Candidatus Thermoplasmatota archaeon]